MNKPLMSKKLFISKNKHVVLPDLKHNHLAYKVSWEWRNQLAASWKDRDWDLYEHQKKTFPQMYAHLKAQQCAWFEVREVAVCADVLEVFEMTVNLRKMRTEDLAKFKNILDSLQLLIELMGD